MSHSIDDPKLWLDKIRLHLLSVKPRLEIKQPYFSIRCNRKSFNKAKALLDTCFTETGSKVVPHAYRLDKSLIGTAEHGIIRLSVNPELSDDLLDIRVSDIATPGLSIPALECLAMPDAKPIGVFLTSLVSKDN